MIDFETFKALQTALKLLKLFQLVIIMNLRDIHKEPTIERSLETSRSIFSKASSQKKVYKNQSCGA